MRKMNFEWTLSNSLHPSEPQPGLRWGACTQSPSSLVWISARSELTVQFDLSPMEKGKWVKQLLSRRNLERLACGGQDPAEKWGQHCFLGRPVSPGQASTEMWSPWDTGVCAFSCLREEGLEEGVGHVSWVSREAASCQGILGAIGKSRHSLPPALDRA